jgi:2-keto-4-pentenoate hydratase
MLDGPFGAVRFLLHNLHSRGIAVQSGWWVSSGAITGVHDVASGDRIEAHFGALGSVPAEIAESS